MRLQLHFYALTSAVLTLFDPGCDPYTWKRTYTEFYVFHPASKRWPTEAAHAIVRHYLLKATWMWHLVSAIVESHLRCCVRVWQIQWDCIMQFRILSTCWKTQCLLYKEEEKTLNGESRRQLDRIVNSALSLLVSDSLSALQIATLRAISCFILKGPQSVEPIFVSPLSYQRSCLLNKLLSTLNEVVYYWYDNYLANSITLSMPLWEPRI